MKLNSQLLADGDAVALLQRIQELRQELPGGSRRLPGWSWQAVGDLAHRHGIWRTAKFFRFKSSDFKRHLLGACEDVAVIKRPAPKAAIVELPTPCIQTTNGGVVMEFEDRRGVKITVRGCATRGLDRVGLADSFFRRCR